MTGRALIAHGGPQRYPTRAAPSLMRALRDARGSPPWTPWTILCRLTGTTGLMQPLLLSTVQIAATSRRLRRPRHRVITITGIRDHLQPEWLITITGIRIKAEVPIEFLGTSPTVATRSADRRTDHADHGPISMATV